MIGSLLGTAPCPVEVCGMDSNYFLEQHGLLPQPIHCQQQLVFGVQVGKGRLGQSWGFGRSREGESGGEVKGDDNEEKEGTSR